MDVGLNIFETTLDLYYTILWNGRDTVKFWSRLEVSAKLFAVSTSLENFQLCVGSLVLVLIKTDVEDPILFVLPLTFVIELINMVSQTINSAHLVHIV
jgi:hypothetical protein